MSEKDLEQLKREAAEKAKAAAQRKMERMKATASTEPKAPTPENKQAATAAESKVSEPINQADDNQDLAKAKALAAAKAEAAARAKAAAIAKMSGETASEGKDEEKAIAAAKAKAAAAAKAKAAAAAKASKDEPVTKDTDTEKAKAIAAAKAKAAALAKAGSTTASTEAEAKQEEPSQNQPYLDKYVKVIKDHLGEDVLEDSYINKLSKDVPTLVAKPETYYKIAEFLKYNEQLGFDYLSEHHGSDFVTHFEVYNHLYSYKNRQSVALKVKINHQKPEIDSLTPLWAGANWPERESFDLVGIHYINHPNLVRIMLADDWVGHPLRKDYVPYDVEV